MTNKLEKLSEAFGNKKKQSNKYVKKDPNADFILAIQKLKENKK
jgi:hypothetical protein